MRLWRSTLALLAALMTVLSMTAAPASAARAIIEDRVNDAPRRMDIRSIGVVNEERIAFHTEFRYLRNQSYNSIAFDFLIDTNRRKPGPEYAMSGTLFFEVYFYRRDGWNGPSEFTTCRGFRGRTTAGRFGTVTFNFPRRCLGGPDEVRVMAAAGFPREHDWAPRRLTWTPAVARG